MGFVFAAIPFLVAQPIACAQSLNPNYIKNENFSFATRLHYDSALTNGVQSLNVMVAAKIGRTTEAVQSFARLDGKVVERFDAVGYFWGTIPTVQLPKLLSIPDIVDFQLDGPSGATLDYVEPSDPKTLKPGSVWGRVQAEVKKDDPNQYCPTCPAKPAAKDAKLPLLDPKMLEGDNPYLPWYLMDVPEFLRQHPTFDGRGVTIAVVEGYGDLLHPTLQHALTLDGKPVPKIVGILDTTSASDPMYDDLVNYNLPPPTHVPEPLVLKLTDKIRSTTKTVVFRGKTFTLPAPGSYRIGLLSNDHRSFWVLWSPDTESVWLDTNQNESFADEVALQDTNRQFSAARLPGERPGRLKQTPALPITFAVTIDNAKSELSFFLQQDDHATGVASIAAGAGFLGGNGNGVAPGARILFVTTSLGDYSSSTANLRAFILAASRPDVDVVTSSFTVGPPIGGETVTSLILDRLAVVYQKPLFFLDLANVAINAGAASDMSNGPHVFGTDSYASSDVWHTLYGVSVPLHDNSPDDGIEISINGSIKPDLMAPYYTVAASNCSPDSFDEYDVRNESTATGYKLPPCYTKFAGTSATAPAAAGVAALLISAAKQTGTPHDLARLSWALRNGAKHLEMPEPVGSQGNGLVDVLQSWKLLSSDEPTPSFEIAATSNGALEDYRRTPHIGVGVNEYWDVHSGSSGSRIVTITRESGSPQDTSYSLKWFGNDGTFTSAKTVSLPLNQRVSIPVGFAPKEPGVHQAILQITDPANGTVLAAFVNSVVASQPLSRAQSTYDWKPQPIPLAHQACSAFDVQAGITAIAAHLSLAGVSSRSRNTSNGPLALIQFAASPLLGPDWYLRRAFDSPEIHTTRFYEPGERDALWGHPASGPWAFCVLNPLGSVQSSDQKFQYIQPEITFTALSVDVKTGKLTETTGSNGSTVISGNVQIGNQGSALEGASLQSRVGYEIIHSVDVGAPGQTSEVDVDVSDDTQVLFIKFSSSTEIPGLAASIYKCEDLSAHPAAARVHCRFQDFRQSPGLVEYRLPQKGKWKILLYRMQPGQTDPVDVDVVQIPPKDGQRPLARILVDDGAPVARQKAAQAAESVKVEDAKPIGPFASGTTRIESFNIQVPSAKLPGTPVVVNELYDLPLEKNASEFEKYFVPFDSFHSRPIAIGLSIDRIPTPPSNDSR